MCAACRLAGTNNKLGRKQDHYTKLKQNIYYNSLHTNGNALYDQANSTQCS